MIFPSWFAPSPGSIAGNFFIYFYCKHKFIENKKPPNICKQCLMHAKPSAKCLHTQTDTLRDANEKVDVLCLCVYENTESSWSLNKISIDMCCQYRRGGCCGSSHFGMCNAMCCTFRCFGMRLIKHDWMLCYFISPVCVCQFGCLVCCAIFNQLCVFFVLTPSLPLSLSLSLDSIWNVIRMQ